MTAESRNFYQVSDQSPVLSGNLNGIYWINLIKNFNSPKKLIGVINQYVLLHYLAGKLEISQISDTDAYA
jgi:hypothetical protein